MKDSFEKLKDKVDGYVDPIAKMAFVDGVISISIILAEEEGEEVPEYVKELQGVFDGLRKVYELMSKSG